MECLSSRREREAPLGGARENRKFIQAPSPEIWSETISGGEKVLAEKWGGLFLGGYLLGKNLSAAARPREWSEPPWPHLAIHAAEHPPRITALNCATAAISTSANPLCKLRFAATS